MQSSHVNVKATMKSICPRKRVAVERHGAKTASIFLCDQTIRGFAIHQGSGMDIELAGCGESKACNRYHPTTCIALYSIGLAR